MTTVDARNLVDQANGRWPRAVRFVLLTLAWGIALGAALAPMVYLLRRIGVG